VAIGPDKPLAGVTVLADSEGEIRRAYGAAGPSAFLIRPDGHIAARIPLPRPEAADVLPGLQAIAIGG
jgi:peroxiredoxin